MMLNVQEFLQEKSLEELEEKYGIVSNRYDDRVVLNYHQIDSYKHRFHPIIQECRALILSLPEYNIMCRSFDRFYNLGENQSDNNFNISESVAFEKIDGSLINVYWDFFQLKWVCSTRKMAFAEGETALGNTFTQVFEKAIGYPVYNIPSLTEEKTHYTYIFEVVSPETRVVKPYPDYKCYLLAVRDNLTGKFCNTNTLAQEADLLGVDIPKIYPLKTLDDINNYIDDNFEAFDEGFVLQWQDPNCINTRRIKIKNPRYLAIAHLRGEGVLTPKKILTLVISQETEEYLAYFPEDRQYFDPYINAYYELRGYVNGLWGAVKDIKNQKDFALAVKDTPVGSILFSMRKGQVFSDILKNMTDNARVRLFEYFKEKI